MKAVYNTGVGTRYKKSQKNDWSETQPLWSDTVKNERSFSNTQT